MSEMDDLVRVLGASVGELVRWLDRLERATRLSSTALSTLQDRVSDLEDAIRQSLK